MLCFYQHNKIVILARSKLSNTESKIFEALIKKEINLEDFTTITDEEKSYRGPKESIRLMKSQRNDTENSNLIEEDKRKCIDETIRQNA